jgi:hypothetical protein
VPVLPPPLDDVPPPVPVVEPPPPVPPPPFPPHAASETATQIKQINLDIEISPIHLQHKEPSLQSVLLWQAHSPHAPE